jgi:hypothetical protein
MAMEHQQILHLTEEKPASTFQDMKAAMTRGILFSQRVEQLSSKIQQILQSRSIFTSHSDASMAALM